MENQEANNDYDMEQARHLRREQESMRKINFRGFSNLAKKRKRVEEVEIEIDELKNKINDARFDGGVFYAILLLSIAKDLIDVLTLGIIGTIANFFIVPLLFITSLLRGTRIKSKLIKRFIIPMGLETIFGLNMLPLYTLTTLILKVMADHKVNGLKAELAKAQKKLKKI